MQRSGAFFQTMKKHGTNRDKDGAGRVPAGNRRVQALGWVYHHLSLRGGEALRGLAAKALMAAVLAPFLDDAFDGLAA